MKLSICVITMNRAAQLKEALESCLFCELPKETEFVVIDNASSDDTEQTVHTVLGECGYSYYYEKLAKNLGVGGGRNYAYEKSCGNYTYMLDDDAVIDVEKNPDFFLRAINILNENSDIVTLTTQIYDTAWKKNRLDEGGPIISEELYKCLMFCGGSHFLRRAFYEKAPYLPNKYGYEEIPPSLVAMDAGKINAFCANLWITHKPAVNKWDWHDEKNHELLIKEIALPYAIKKMMYPTILAPMLWLAATVRTKKYAASITNAKKQINDMKRMVMESYPVNRKIALSTLVKMFKDFGLSVF